MPIRLKVALTEREVDDALWVRHEVFVKDDGKFGGKPLPGERVVDRYDAFPDVRNIVVYEEEQPIATMRLIKESPIGLPAFDYFDFSAYRKQAEADRLNAGLSGGVVLGSAGMLAIRKPWRMRRDVIRAMFKVAAGVSQSAGTTHIVVVVNYDTAGMYRRLGFQALSERFWAPSVGNHVIPLATSVEHFHAWAFGDLPRTPLDTFRDSFERLFLRSGEVVFSEGALGSHAYIVDSGTVRIARKADSGAELTLAHLDRGELFGELALVDNAPRSASAYAATDVELITLERRAFLDELYSEPQCVQELLQVFCQRIRRMDDLAMVLAFAPPEQRLDFALTMVRTRSVPDPAHPGVLLFSGGADDLATSAAVDSQTAVDFLDERRTRGELDYSTRHIRFYN